MSALRTRRTPPPGLAEAWWPLEDVAPTGSRWHAEHLTGGWWDPGDLPRSRLRHATALVDELLASLPHEAVVDGASVLELGCGPGTGLQELARRWPCELHGWDPSQDARTAARAMAPAARIAQSATLPLALADASVAVVWLPRGLARGGSDWAELVAEAHRVLRPGGLLAAVLAGPGVWAWEEREDAWAEELTGMLLVGLDRPGEHGGPTCFTSRWWLDEHVGRGFETVVLRRAGVAMLHPDQGYGLGVWRRRPGPAMTAARFAALEPASVREGRALRHQLELAHAEARALASARAAALAAAEARAAQLTRPDAVDGHPRVRDALRAVTALEAEVQRLRELPRAAPAPPALRTIASRLRASRGGSS